MDYVLRVSGKSLMRKQFHTFPIDEIDAYTQIMIRITSSKGDSRKIILRVLSWIRYAETRLSIDELREVIWVEEKDTQLNTEDINGFGVNDIIRNCESLVATKRLTRLGLVILPSGSSLRRATSHVSL